jgi:hypothetical protein
MITDENVIERFEKKINFNANEKGCWLWVSTLTKKGYGEFSYKNKTYRAHRISWLIYKTEPLLDVNESGEKMVVDHLCNCKNCVRPDHLKNTTHKHNISKGRCSEEGNKRRSENGKKYCKINCLKNFGENHGRAELTAAKALEIYNLKDSGRSKTSVADEYNTTRQNIYNIWTKRNWKCLHA